MGREHGQWWSERSDESLWPSGTLSLVLTGALFTAAFVSMTTVRFSTTDVVPRDSDPPLVVHLDPPLVVTPPVPRRAPPPPPAPAVTPPAIVPTTVPTMIPPTPAAIDRRGATTVTPVSPPLRDTTATTARPSSADPIKPSLTQIGPTRMVPTFAPAVANNRGAPIAPAGVTIHSETISPATRDSIATERTASIPFLAAKRKATPDETRALRAQQAPGLRATDRAARLPGEPVVAPLMNGGFSVAIPVVSLGGGKIDRSRDDSLHAEFQRRLRAFQGIIVLRRDSIRADSLKRDSSSRARKRP